MGVVIETCIKYPGGRTRIRVTDIELQGVSEVPADILNKNIVTVT